MDLPVADGLTLRRHGPVVEATIDSGPENLMSMPMCRALTAVLVDPPAGARLLHLRAEGPVFCLGRDRGGTDEAGVRAEAEVLVGLNRALQEGQLVTVAEVAGDAAGYGVGLAALADLSFATGSARFWFPEVLAGLAPTVVLSWLPRLVGRSQAFRLTASGMRIDGREAARLGLVTGVVDPDSALAGTVQAEIATLLDQAPRAQQDIRAFLAASAATAPGPVDELAVERLVASSLRLRLGGLGAGGSDGGGRPVGAPQGA